MFVDFQDWPPPPSDPEPRPEPRRMTPRDERVLLWLIGANLVLVALAPIAGGSVLQLVWALFGD